jgi:hypothetical protein
LLLFPTIGLAIASGLSLQSSRTSNPEAVRLLRWVVLPQLLFFLLLAGRMQVLTSWLVPAWWMAVPLAAAALAPAAIARRRWFLGSAAVTLLLVPPLSLFAAAHVRWGLGRVLIPNAVDTSSQLMDPVVLRRSLQRQPLLWRELQGAQVIASNRYELPGFLALALSGRTKASFTTLSSDRRGFRFWSRGMDPSATRGVLFAVVGDYATIASMNQQGDYPDLRPLARVQLYRQGQRGPLLEFYSFNPSQHRSALIEPGAGD